MLLRPRPLASAEIYFQMTENELIDPKGPENDVRGDVLRPPHDAKPAIVKTNKFLRKQDYIKEMKIAKNSKCDYTSKL